MLDVKFISRIKMSKDLVFHGEHLDKKNKQRKTQKKTFFGNVKG